MTALPLSRIRVLDFTLIWAGPYGAMLLSDMGAEVIRVESCQHHINNTRGHYAAPTKEVLAKAGSLGKLYPDVDPGERPWNRYAIFNGLGRDRYSMTADLTRPEGRAIVHELVKISDVLIENNTVGLLDRFGLDWGTVHRLNPSLVYVAMPIFGVKGPYASYIGYGNNAAAISGLGSLSGYAEGDRSMTGAGAHMDATSGIGAAYATLVALYDRARTGRGCFIEFAQMEHLVHQLGGALMDAAMNGRAQTPMGNRHAVRAPQGIYPCAGKDRWIAISVGTDEEWQGLCRAMGHAELAAVPEFAGNLARQGRHDEVDRLIAGWTATLDARAALQVLQEHRVPAGLVANDRDVYEDPHLEARGFFHWMHHPECGRHRYPGHAFKYSGTPLRFDAPAPLLGEHNDLVYRQLLGLSPAEVQRLRDLGHIGDRYTEDAIREG